MDNIGVAIRVRPMVLRELSKEAEEHWKVNGNNIFQVENGVQVPSIAINPTSFIFDKVYAGNDTTESLYDEFAKPLVLKAVEGFNGTIFAYGQTGTGKTYTMMGLPENPGVIPRAITDTFELVHMAHDREFLIRVSYMEIYNEVITDLLKPLNNHLKVRNNERNEVFVENLTEVPITSPEEALSWLQDGESHRRFGETNMNERSSRSHTIFRVTIESKLCSSNLEDNSPEDGAVNVSQLNLVDLAGSERAAHTGAQGTRLKESGFINKSLLTLGTVISKLSSQGEERNFVPYRDSKLTRILQNSLGGNAKTSVIATVSAAAGEETFSTLKFASRAKTIKNKPKVNEVLDGDTMIRRYRKEINMLKQQIGEMQDLSKIKTLKTENEKMEQLLEENERMRREQQAKINNLQKLIITTTEETMNLKRKKLPKAARRETWCPGKLKRSLAQSSLENPLSLSVISSGDESAEDGEEMTFGNNKNDFILELEKEERNSIEKFKKKNSRGATSSSTVKYRRSYQAGTTLTLKVDQACQTEIAKADADQMTEGTIEEQSLLEKLDKLSAEKEEQSELVAMLKLRLENLQSEKQNKIDSTEQEIQGVESKESPRSKIGTRRKGDEISPELYPLKKRQFTVEESFLENQEAQSSNNSPSKVELKEELSLANFLILEKEIHAEEIQNSLKIAENGLKEKELAIRELENQIESLASAEKKICSLSAEVESLEKKCGEITKSKEEAEKNFAEAKEEMTKFKSMVQEERDGIVQTECKLHNLIVKNKDLLWKVKELEDVKSHSNLECNPAEPDVKSLQDEIKRLQQQVIELEGAKTELSLRIEDLEMEKSSKGHCITDSLLKQDDSLLNETSKLGDLETVFMERAAAVEELNLKIEELQLENECLRNKNQQQGSHMELLVQENLGLQAEIKNTSDKTTESEDKDQTSDDQIERLVLKIVELEDMNKELQSKISSTEENQNDKASLMQQLAEKDEIINNFESAQVGENQCQEVGKSELQMKTDELERINEEHQKKSIGNDILEREKINDQEFEEMTQKIKALEDLNETLQNEINGKPEKIGEGNTEGNEELEDLKIKFVQLEMTNENLRAEIQEKGKLLTGKCLNENAESQEMIAELKERVEELLSLKKKNELEIQEKTEQESTISQAIEGFRKNISELENENQELREKVQEVTKIYAEKESENVNLASQEEVEELKKKIVELNLINEELRIKTNQETNSNTSGKDDQTEVEIASNEIKELQDKITELEVINKDLKNDLSEAKKKVDLNSDRQEEMTMVENVMEGEIGKLNERIAELEKTNEELRAEIDRKSEIYTLKEEGSDNSNDLHEEIANLERKIDDLEEVNRNLQGDNAEKNELLAAKEKLSTSCCKVEDMRLKITELELRNEELVKDQSGKNEEVVSYLKSELEELKLKINELEDLNTKLEKELAEKDVALNGKEGLFGEIDRLKMELEETKASANDRNQNESTDGHFERLTMKIIDLEEANEELLSKIAKADSLENENSELVERLSEQEKIVSNSSEVKGESDELLEKVKDLEETNEEIMLMKNKLEDENNGLKSNIASLQKEIEGLNLHCDEMKHYEVANKGLNENVSGLEDKCSTLTKQLSMLSADLESAEDHNITLIEKVNELNEKQKDADESDGLLLKLKELKAMNEEVHLEKKRLEEENSWLKENIGSLEKEIEGLKSHSGEIEQLEATNKGLNENVTSLEGKCSTLTNQLSMLSADLESAEDQNIALTEKVNQLTEKSERMGESEGLLLKLKHLEAMSEETNLMKKKLEDENSGLKENIESLEKEVEDLKLHYEGAEQLEATNKGFNENVLSLENKCSTLTKQLSMLSADLESAEDQNIALTEKVNQLSERGVEIDLTELEEKNNGLKEELSRLQQSKQELENTLSEFETKYSKASERLSMLSNDLHSAEEENMALLEKIGLLNQENREKDEAHETQFKELRAEMEGLKFEISEKEAKISWLEHELPSSNDIEVRDENQSLKSMVSELAQQKTELEGRVETLQDKCLKMTEQLKLLSDDLEAAQDENIALVEKMTKEQQELKARGEKSRCQLEKVQCEVDVLQSKLGEKEETIAQLKFEISTAKDNKDIEEANDRLRGEISDQKKINSELEKELLTLEDKCASLSKNFSVLSNELQSAEDEKTDLLEKMSEMKQKNEDNAEDTARDFEKLQVEAESLKKQLKQSKGTIEQLQAEMDRLQEAINSLNEEKDRKTQKMRETLDILSEKEKTSMEELTNMKKLLIEKEKLNIENENEITELQSEIRNLNSNLQKTFKENSEKEEKIRTLKETFEDEHSAAVKEISKLKEQNIEIESSTTRLKREITHLKEMLQEAVGKNEEQEEEILRLEKMVGEKDKNGANERYQLTEALKSSAAKEREALEEISNLKKKLLEKEVGNASDEASLLEEIASLKSSLLKLNEEKQKKDKEIKKLEKMVDDSDAEIEMIGYELKSSQENERAYQKEIVKLQKRCEELNNSTETQNVSMKKENFCDSIRIGALERENEKLKDKLAENEAVRFNYQKYQEKRISMLKLELKKLAEVSSKASVTNENKETRNVVESTALFSLKSEKMTLEREVEKLKSEMEDVNKKNNMLSLERFNLESKYNTLRSECYQLKRGLRVASKDSETQTEKELYSSFKAHANGGQENFGHRRLFQPDNSPFKETKEDPQQCAQQ